MPRRPGERERGAGWTRPVARAGGLGSGESSGVGRRWPNCEQEVRAEVDGGGQWHEEAQDGGGMLIEGLSAETDPREEEPDKEEREWGERK